MTDKKDTKTSKKSQAKKPNRKVIPLEDDVHTRLARLSDTAGIPVNKLAHHMLMNVLNVVENGGEISVDLTTGNIRFGQVRPALPPQHSGHQRPPMPPPPPVHDPGYRTIDLSGE